MSGRQEKGPRKSGREESKTSGQENEEEKQENSNTSGGEKEEEKQQDIWRRERGGETAEQQDVWTRGGQQDVWPVPITQVESA